MLVRIAPTCTHSPPYTTYRADAASGTARQPSSLPNEGPTLAPQNSVVEGWALLIGDSITQDNGGGHELRKW